MIHRIMKCTPIQLQSRSEHGRWKLKKLQNNAEPVHVTKEYHGYSFTFSKTPTPTPRTQPKLSVKVLKPPENLKTFNTGCSLEKWSKKKPRLKSGTKNHAANIPGLDQDYDINMNVSNILDRLDEISEFNEDVDDAKIDEYEVSSDIEELIRKSQEISQLEVDEKRSRKRGKTSRDDRRTDEERSRRKIRSKLEKRIRFSFSKPASPNTEQIIRVDVTSSVSVDELRHIRNDLNSGDCNERRAKMIDESKRESDGSFNENGVIKFDREEEEFIIRCSQLAITQKRR